METTLHPSPYWAARQRFEDEAALAAGTLMIECVVCGTIESAEPGPVVTPKYDATQTYVLACGHRAI